MANASTAREIEQLAATIGDKAYLDVAKWHLYLKDAKLHTVLAEKLYPLLSDNRLSEDSLAEVLQSTPVPLGGGRTQVTLRDVMPTGSQADLLQALEEYQRNL
ncbi:MAG: DUF3181 family protein [Leptolyngbya sp. LCM1.Bin17]|nr:MAG: DUF3181 family protein [Leptolyngbya sp. LCM1.Bin17]